MLLCSKCRLEKPCSEFYPEPRNKKRGFASYCKPCAIDKAKRWRAENIEYAKQMAHARYVANPPDREMARQRYENWKRRNPGKEQANSRAWRSENRERLILETKQQVEALDDSYVRRQLVKKTPIKLADIPQELIELKREQLMLRRLARELKKAAANKQENQ